MIGPHIEDELRAAGLLGLAFTWGSDGALEFGASVTPEQRAAIAAVFAAHNPSDAAKLAAYHAARRAREFDEQKLIKAVAIWTAQKLNVPLPEAKAEIMAVYQALP